jgi:hypothetical protein
MGQIAIKGRVMNYEQAWNRQMGVARQLEKQLLAIKKAAAAVVAMECGRVNTDDPIANPGQFDERIVALALAIEPPGDVGNKSWEEV